MANKTPRGKWVPGVSPNPKGRSPASWEAEVIRSHKFEDFMKLSAEVANLTPGEAETFVKRDTVTLFERAVGMLLIKAATGDMDALKIMLDRMVGKPPELGTPTTLQQTVIVDITNHLKNLPIDKVIELARAGKP